LGVTAGTLRKRLGTELVEQAVDLRELVGRQGADALRHDVSRKGDQPVARDEGLAWESDSYDTRTLQSVVRAESDLLDDSVNEALSWRNDHDCANVVIRRREHEDQPTVIDLRPPDLAALHGQSIG
jgi:hypothetical protein